MVEQQKIVLPCIEMILWNSMTLDVLMEENIIQFVKHHQRLQVMKFCYTIDYVELKPILAQRSKLAWFNVFPDVFLNSVIQ